MTDDRCVKFWFIWCPEVYSASEEETSIIYSLVVKRIHKQLDQQGQTWQSVGLKIYF